VVNAGFLMSEDGPTVSGPPPKLGEHTREILQDLGYSDAQIQALNLPAGQPDRD